MCIYVSNIGISASCLPDCGMLYCRQELNGESRLGSKWLNVVMVIWAWVQSWPLQKVVVAAILKNQFLNVPRSPVDPRALFLASLKVGLVEGKTTESSPLLRKKKKKFDPNTIIVFFLRRFFFNGGERKGLRHARGGVVLLTAKERHICTSYCSEAAKPREVSGEPRLATVAPGQKCPTPMCVRVCGASGAETRSWLSFTLQVWTKNIPSSHGHQRKICPCCKLLIQ